MPREQILIGINAWPWLAEFAEGRMRELADAFGVPALMIEDPSSDGEYANGRPSGAGPFCRLMPSGQEIEPTVKKIFHPHGRFETPDGNRFDVCIMEAKSDPSIQMPGPLQFGRGEKNRHAEGIFKGERATTEDDRQLVGYSIENYCGRPRLGCTQEARTQISSSQFLSIFDQDVGRPII